jgi:hypothetical protein
MTLHVTLLHLQKFLSVRFNDTSAETDKNQPLPTREPNFISERLEIKPVGGTDGEPVSPS